MSWFNTLRARLRGHMYMATEIERARKRAQHFPPLDLTRVREQRAQELREQRQRYSVAGSAGLCNRRARKAHRHGRYARATWIAADHARRRELWLEENDLSA